MRLTDIISLAQQYLVLGLIFAAVVGAAAAVGYFLVYRKLMKGEKRVRPLQVLWGATVICYLVVLFCATLLDRYDGSGWWAQRGFLPLFYSYRDAWNSFSESAWRNIVLNILLFVPLGFLLPLGMKRFRRFWVTYLAGLLCTVFIEMMQLILQRGVAELDDILNNFLGTMIGYGCYAVVRSIRNALAGKKADPLRLTALQIPLIGTGLMFLAIAAVYQHQELGNLTLSWIVRQDMDGVEVRSSASYSDEEGEAPVYRLRVLAPEESREFAEQFFAAHGQTLDESRIDQYENTAFYWSVEGNSLAVDYAGETWSYTDISLAYPEEGGPQPEKGASEVDVRDALAQWGTDLPREAVFEEQEDGWYCFTVDGYADENGMMDGTLSCQYYQNGGLGTVNNQILECESYKDFPVISQAEAFEMIREGKFTGWFGEISELNLGSAVLRYETDSKGFRQPVWFFPLEGEEEGSGIAVPALAG